jgi:hypothetical protein
VDPILIATWAIVAVVVVAYAAFVVWRVRVQRRKNAPAAVEAAGADDARLARALEAAARIAGTPPIPPVPASAPEMPTASGSPVAANPIEAEAATTEADAPGVSSVAELLEGIKLPNDLAPLTTMAPREGAGDRVAFWTDTAPIEIVGPAFIAALALIGCEISQLSVEQFALRRKGTRAMTVFYPDGRLAMIDGAPGYPSVPTAAFVVEVYLPAR